MSELSAVITNIQRFSTEDGPGIRTTVFFKGCPLGCPWCHNPEGLSQKPQLAFHPGRCINCGECTNACSIKAPSPGSDSRCKVCGKCADACPTGAREIIGREVTVEELVKEVSRDEAFYGADGGVTISGGEAALQSEFVAEFFKKCRDLEIHTVLDTSGAVARSKLEAILEHTDMVLFDLKIMDEDRHREIIKYPLAPLIESLEFIAQSGKPIWIRFPIIPELTDDEKNIDAIIAFLKNLPNLERVDLLPFHQLGLHKYAELGMPYSLGDMKSPEDASVEIVRRTFIDAGLPVPSTKS